MSFLISAKSGFILPSMFILITWFWLPLMAKPLPLLRISMALVAFQLSFFQDPFFHVFIPKASFPRIPISGFPQGPIPEFHIGLIPGWKALQPDFSEALQCVLEAPSPVGADRAGTAMRHMATMPTSAKDLIVNFMVLLTSVTFFEKCQAQPDQ
jgi:hypothetical protein